MLRRIAVTGAVLALAAGSGGCAWLQEAAPPALAQLAQKARLVDAPAPELPGQIEPVHAAAIAQDEAVFWVSSNGCTAKADLTPVVVRRDGDASVISLRRIKEDRCHDPRPEGLEVRWTFQEMGLEPGAQVSVENPYQLPRG